ncbi:MAG: transporter substrate-binding domain-containing protein [Spirochaetes bacterium]|nr:transporter substrate-binding domain-containing protein [Spirochaetota bacterium]
MRKVAYFLLFNLVFFFNCNFAPSEKTDISPDAVSSGSKKITDSIQISYFDVEPHIFFDKNTGKLSGALFDLIEKYISPEMGIKFLWDSQPTTIARQLESLKSKDYYSVALLVDTPERKKIYKYSDEPYFFSKSVITVRSDFPLKKIKNIDSIADIKIGYADNAFITPFVNNTKINFDFIYEPNYHEVNFKKLLAKRIDGVYAPDKAALLAISRRMNITDKIRIIDIPEKSIPFYVVFSKNSTEIAYKFNKTAKKLNIQKLYLLLLNNYINSSQL